MMELCDVHTVLRLPTGIFYAQGVRTNVVFLTRGSSDKGNTKAVWVFDLRNQMEAFGKTHPLSLKDFADFEKAFGHDPYGRSVRKDQGSDGRFRQFTRAQIAERFDSLEISWLRDTEVEAEEHLTEPEDIAAAIIGHLKIALDEMEFANSDIEGDDEQQVPLIDLEAAQ